VRGRNGEQENGGYWETNLAGADLQSVPKNRPDSKARIINPR